MEIICEDCKKKYSFGVKLKASITVEGDSRINSTCPFCGHTNQLSHVRLEFTSAGDIKKVTALDSKPEDLRFFDIPPIS